MQHLNQSIGLLGHSMVLQLLEIELQVDQQHLYLLKIKQLMFD